MIWEHRRYNAHTWVWGREMGDPGVKPAHRHGWQMNGNATHNNKRRKRSSFLQMLSLNWHWREAIQLEMSRGNCTISVLNLRLRMAMHIENVSMYVFVKTSLVYWIIPERLRKWEEAWGQNLGSHQHLKVERKNRTRKDRDLNQEGHVRKTGENSAMEANRKQRNTM